MDVGVCGSLFTVWVDWLVSVWCGVQFGLGLDLGLVFIVGWFGFWFEVC